VRTGLVFFALVLALALQTTVDQYVKEPLAVDLVLVMVVYVGLVSGPIGGLAAGTVAGLAQDALASGVLGIGGLAKTLAGFFAGIVGSQFILMQPIPRFLAFVAATVLHGVVFMGLYMVLDLRQFPRPYATVAIQAAGNAFIGVILCHLADVLPGSLERRRTGRGRVDVTRLRR
jgi:rod shape-determining protein MreD